MDGGQNASSGLMVSGDKTAAFATRSERALVLSIVREDFGDVAERVAETLLRSEGLRLPEIAHKLQRQSKSSSSVHEVSKCGSCHNTMPLLSGSIRKY